MAHAFLNDSTEVQRSFRRGVVIKSRFEIIAVTNYKLKFKTILFKSIMVCQISGLNSIT